MSLQTEQDQAFTARFRPIFARIAERAAEREHGRELAHDAIGWLREAGFASPRTLDAPGPSPLILATKSK